ncbi:ComEA family DNA-binding protein [Tamlana sp. I1]|uniref:ComEA family DNA-binding protein n=1 Tax=Tamlana sp. I1 TaxID=2762061 RepID=UPI00188F4678|nr:helix-hairpin-helix domain-containing protein [Tamlana sp. I1]
MKSHFTFSKNQRNGIFLLVVLIVVFQSIYVFVDFSSEDIKVNKTQLAFFEKEVDSLRLLKLEEAKPKMKPFNPNYIDDYKGSALGMTTDEIDRLLAFRKQNKWINSSEQFKAVTQISDSLFNVISPYFKFPNWVDTSAEKKSKPYSNHNTPKSYSQKDDLNKVTAQQLQMVNGVGKVLSERIIKYRNTFVGGFISDVQLEEVYGLSPEVIQKITNTFTVKTPKIIQKIDLNTSTVEDLVTIPYIDYDLAYEIIEQRQLRAGYKSWNDLLKVKDFPVNKINIIRLYLLLEKKINE